jgi:SpoVK/Ycf46/Vps4 family AAA+-type ATPase
MAKVTESPQCIHSPQSQGRPRITRPSTKLLILIDELARYLTVAAGITVGKSTLADQTTAFLMALLEAVGTEARTSVVITLTAETEAYGEVTHEVVAAIDEALSLTARKAHIIRGRERH